VAKWEKSPESLIQLFGRILPEDPAVERRRMFGYPCAFVRGNMFAGLFAKEMFVRLAEEERRMMIAGQGAKPLEPMPGRAMKEYVVIPPGIMSREAALKDLVARSLTFAKSLAPKGKKTSGEKRSGGTSGTLAGRKAG
jgi:TfoX/Sxy family transcriptional regulator of competence genes